MCARFQDNKGIAVCDRLTREDRSHTGHPSAPREWVWDALLESRSIGRIAVAVRPTKERIGEAHDEAGKRLVAEEAARPAGWTPQWREALVDGVATVLAGSRLPGDWFPALDVPRFVHGQSQGICDLFGARAEPQPDGNWYVHPLPADPGGVESITARPLKESMYWGAVEWVRYAYAASGGCFAFRNPVMTGPLDTANYLLGTTVLLEWVHTEPAALHRLLDTISHVGIAMVAALREAAGGALHGDSLWCVRGAFCLCSECRSLVSARVYEEFEAPCLRRIGEALGPYGIHSCGSWERTIPSALEDPNLRVMNGQVRENDLAQLCNLAERRVTLSIGPSEHLDDRYTWADTASFLEHVLAIVPSEQPLEVALGESDWELWKDLYFRIRGERFRGAT